MFYSSESLGNLQNLREVVIQLWETWNPIFSYSRLIFSGLTRTTADDPEKQKLNRHIGGTGTAGVVVVRLTDFRSFVGPCRAGFFRCGWNSVTKATTRSNANRCLRKYTDVPNYSTYYPVQAERVYSARAAVEACEFERGSVVHYDAPPT